VTIEARGTLLRVVVDGAEHVLRSQIVGGWRGVLLESPGPNEREYQVDGSDTTSSDDRDAALLAFPLYGVDGWLRDEGSYSRWEHLRVVDLDTGQPVSGALPANFVVDADLRRPEAPAHLWLLGPAEPLREGLELDRRNARWVVERFAGSQAALPRWFFPEQPLPFVAELLHLVGRSAAAAFALAVLARLFSRAIDLVRIAGAQGVRWPPWWPKARLASELGAAAAWSALPTWLLASLLVSWRIYHQLPHILDAVSYDFQARVLETGQLALAVPPLVDAFKGPFELALDGRWFSQYPPGAAAAYALGGWLAGPLCGVLLVGSTGWVARRLYGPGTQRVTVLLGVLSPFVLFQSGSYLSHPISGALVGLSLAAFVFGEQRHSRGYLACGAVLGAAFLVREVAAVLFALPLAIRLFSLKRWRALFLLLVAGVPFLAVYLAYNAAQTGNPFLLPRAVFDPTDHFGFGDNIGFHQRHTLAAGLANTDELLTLLQFDLFGWPPLFALGLLGLPFLLGRAQTWDGVAAEGFLTFVVAYVAYFYHGIALGPRYYFDALPWLLLLAGRGVQSLAEVARGSRLAAALVVGPLCVYGLLFYLPAELARRADYSGLPDGRPAVVSFVEPTVFGPRLVGLPDHALVLTDDWWLFNAALAALNCPSVPDCPVLFALATTDGDRQLLARTYPGRQVLRVVDTNGTLTVAP
jgi:hypothetical protein